MPKLAKKYLNDTLDQVRKMFLLGGSGSLLIFILLVTFISIYIERREVAQLVKNEEKEVENTMEGFFNKILPQSTIEHFNLSELNWIYWVLGIFIVVSLLAAIGFAAFIIISWISYIISIPSEVTEDLAKKNLAELKRMLGNSAQEAKKYTNDGLKISNKTMIKAIKKAIENAEQAAKQAAEQAAAATS